MKTKGEAVNNYIRAPGAKRDAWHPEHVWGQGWPGRWCHPSRGKKIKAAPREGTKAAEATGKWTLRLMQEERSREPGASRPQEHGAPQDAGWCLLRTRERFYLISAKG